MIIRTPGELSALLRELEAAVKVIPYVGFDTEYHGQTTVWKKKKKNKKTKKGHTVDPLTARMTGFSLAWFRGTDVVGCYIPVEHVGDNANTDSMHWHFLWGFIWDSNACTLVCHNMMADLRVGKNFCGRYPRNRTLDTMVLGKLLNQGAPDPNPKLAAAGKQVYGLKPMTLHHRGHRMLEYEDVVGTILEAGPTEVEVEQAVMEERRRIIEERFRLGRKREWTKANGTELTRFEKRIRKDQIYCQRQMNECTAEEVELYGMDDSVQALHELMYLRKRCSRREWEYFTTVELPSVHVAREMTDNGMPVSVPYLEDLREKALPVKEDVEREWKERTGTDITSGKQVSAYLYRELWEPDDYTPRTKGGGYATDNKAVEWALRKFPKGTPAHDLALLKKKHAEVAKIITTYTKGMIAELPYRLDGRIHPEINVIGTDTGRWSCKFLHQVPRSKAREKREQAAKDAFLKWVSLSDIRGAFVAPEGWSITAGDYQQGEIVVMAHLSGDETLRKIVLGGLSMHDVTAQALGLDKPTAKIVNFAMNYGGYPRKIALSTGMTLVKVTSKDGRVKLVAPQKAVEYWERYRELYAGVTAFKESMSEFCMRHGYVETIMGRRRYLPDIHSPVYWKVWAAQRQASNAPVQGSLGDIMKVAKVNLSRRWHGLKNRGRLLLLSVHDEIVTQTRDDVREEAEREMREEMENAASVLSLPLRVDVKSGKSWAECK